MFGCPLLTTFAHILKATLSDKRAQKEALLAELEQVQEETARHQEALLVCAAEVR